jgi:hypothetical protein
MIDADPSTTDSSMKLRFAEREYIDIHRTRMILGLSHSTVRELYQRGMIDILDFRPGGRKRVRYRSVVDLCDQLRERYCVADRRPPLPNPIFRHRDEDILPFPLSDTLTVPKARDILGYASSTPIFNLCEEGAFEAYHFTASSPWRISRRSFTEYTRNIKNREHLAVGNVNRLSHVTICKG